MFKMFKLFSLSKRTALKRKLKIVAVSVLAVIVIVLILTFASPFRFDYAAGSHRITPTAVDTNLWGNYVVYYRTTDLTRESEEGIYYIEKGNTAIANQLEEAMVGGNEVVVFYDRYVGWKGFTAPRTSPITRVEVVDS